LTKPTSRSSICARMASVGDTRDATGVGPLD
jgi:hypothetical protein